MKRVQLQKMVSVRDLLRNVRTHSVMAIIVSVTLVTVVGASIASRVLFTIEADASSIDAHQKDIDARLEEEARAMEAYAGEMRLRMDGVAEALDTIEASIDAGNDAVLTIERSLTEIGSIDVAMKSAFEELCGQMNMVRTYVTDTRTCLTELDVKIGQTQRLTPADRDRIESMMEKACASAVLVVDHFTLLANDVSAVMEGLRTYNVQARPFTDAVRTLEEIFLAGMKNLKLSIGRLAEEEVEIGDTTSMMLAKLKLSMKSIDVLTDKIDTSNDIIADLYGQISASNRVIEELRNEIAASGEMINDLSMQLSVMSGDIRTMQDAQAQASELLAAEQRQALEDAAEQQQKALDRAAEQQQEAFKKSGLIRSDGYVTVSFSMDLGSETSYTFDLSKKLSNYGAISRNDILVHKFNVWAAGSNPYYMGLGAAINMDAASYDPSTGRLVVTQRMLQTDLGGKSASVTFAVIGGILQE